MLRPGSVRQYCFVTILQVCVMTRLVPVSIGLGSGRTRWGARRSYVSGVGSSRSKEMRRVRTALLQSKPWRLLASLSKWVVFSSTADGELSAGLIAAEAEFGKSADSVRLRSSADTYGDCVPTLLVVRDATGVEHDAGEADGTSNSMSSSSPLATMMSRVGSSDGMPLRFVPVIATPIGISFASAATDRLSPTGFTNSAFAGSLAAAGSCRTP